ncbi:MAG: NFACT family protein [Candidatus Woesearchaeota archaeon]
MKKEIASLELYYIVKEFQELIGGKFDRIYQDCEDFYFSIFITSKGKKILKVMPNTIYLTDYKPESQAGGFCSFLRRRLSNARIVEIKQHEFERILEIKIQAKEQKYFLIIELFNIGNIILCDENKKIISPFKNKSWSSRTIRGGIQYEYPPVQSNILDMGFEQFVDIVNLNNDKEIVKIIAKELSLGSIYAEEVCFISDIDKNKKGLCKNDLIKVFDNIKKMLNKKIEAVYYEKKKETVPFVLESIGKPDKEFKNYNEALDEIVTEKIFKEKNEEFVKEQKNKENKIQNLLRIQEDNLKKIEADYTENNRKGELIYEHFQEIDSLLKDIHELRKKHGWNEIKKIISRKYKIVKDTINNEGKIVLELE